MSYAKVSKLISDMDNLETFSRMYMKELTRDDSDWDLVNQYQKEVEHARERIFNLVMGDSDD
jgi:hypothetical protein